MSNKDNIYNNENITDDMLDTIQKISKSENIPENIVRRVLSKYFCLYMEYVDNALKIDNNQEIGG